MTDITEQQKRFCRELLTGKNATKAAEAAGYAPKNARQQGSLLLTKSHIKKYLAELSDKAEKNSIMSGVEVLQMLTKIATKAPKSTDCLKALDLLGKHHKLFTEMHETKHTFTKMGRIVIDDNPHTFEVGKPPRAE